MSRLLATLIACCLALALASCGDDGGDENAATPEPAATEEATTEAPTANEFLPEGCEDVEAPAPKEEGTLEAPKEKLDKSKTYVATVSTTCGDFQITLDAKRAPITGGSFKYLADEKFYDGLDFHRIVPDFVIQGGDPAGSRQRRPRLLGRGGRRRAISSTRRASSRWPRPRTEPSGTSGSQFFVVTGEGAASLHARTTRSSARSRRAWTSWTKIGAIQADQNTGMPAAPGDHQVGHGRGVGDRTGQPTSSAPSAVACAG